MLERRFYEDIVKAKEDIDNGIYSDGIYYRTWEYFEFVRSIIINKHMPVRKRIALLTVLGSGTYVDGTRWTNFNMPATSCCCRNYRITVKEFNKGCVEIYTYNEFHKKYEVWKINAHAHNVNIHGNNVYYEYKKHSKHNKAYLHKDLALKCW